MVIITALTVWAVHGTGAGITVRTGVRGGIVHGDITDTAVHGTTADGTVHGASADGMTRGTEEDGTAEDGMTLGITGDGTAGTTLGTIITTIMDGMTRIISRDISQVADRRAAETDITVCVHKRTAAA